MRELTSSPMSPKKLDSILHRHRIGALLLAFGVGACTPESPDATLPKFVFGAVTDRTGSLATPSWQDAFELAVSDVNSALRADGAPFRVQVDLADSENVPRVAVQRAQEMVNGRPQSERIKALITDSSANSIAVHNLQYGVAPAGQALSGPPLNVPIVCIACTSPAINNPNASGATPAADALRNKDKWLYRTVMSATLQAQVLVSAALANARPGRVKVGVYASDDAFGQGFSNAIKAAVLQQRAADGQPAPIVEQLFHPPTADANTYGWAADMALLLDDQTSVMGTATKDQVPDVIMEVTFPQYTAALMNAYRDIGSSVRFLHTHTFRFVSVLQTLANLVEGQEGTSHVVLDTGKGGETAAAREFAERFRQATRVSPSFWDSNSYDAAMSILLAALAAGRGDAQSVSPAQVRDALGKINDRNGVSVTGKPEDVRLAIQNLKDGKTINYQGASGSVDFDADGNVRNKVAYWGVTGNRFQDRRVYDCESDVQCPLVFTGP
jgi:branched-chain amino acid transport system substrate-binding protein